MTSQMAASFASAGLEWSYLMLNINQCSSMFTVQKLYSVILYIAYCYFCLSSAVCKRQLAFSIFFVLAITDTIEHEMLCHEIA